MKKARSLDRARFVIVSIGSQAPSCEGREPSGAAQAAIAFTRAARRETFREALFL